MLNKDTDSLGFGGGGGTKPRGRERRGTLDVGLEEEVMREKHCRELPDLLKPLLACQMNQTTEYWIRKIYDWEFEEVTCDTKYVMWMRSLLFYWQKHIMSREPGPLCITFLEMLHLTDSWAGASQPQGKQGQHALRSYRAVFCVKLAETQETEKGEKTKSKANTNFPSPFPSLNWHMPEHTHAEEPQSLSRAWEGWSKGHRVHIYLPSICCKKYQKAPLASGIMKSYQAAIFIEASKIHCSIRSYPSIVPTGLVGCS